MRKHIITAVTAVALLLGLGAVMASTSEVSPTAGQEQHTYTMKLKPDGTWDNFKDGVKLAAASTEEAGYNPINSWHFGYDIQYRICVADYTAETSTTWDPALIARKWSELNGPTGNSHITMFYDDMNGDVGSCGGWPLRQRLNVYSYGDSTDGYCAWASVTELNGVITRATTWLNRQGDNTNCRQTYTLRQNTASASIGNSAGLAYHTNGNVSVMSKTLSMRLTVPYPAWSDGEAINRRYPYA